MRPWLAAALLLVIGACGRGGGPVQPAAASAANVVDSVRPIEVELARFRAGLAGGEVRELRRGARSRDALVRQFLEAVERRDTATLAALQLDAREFAWLYYPFTPYTHPPYRQAPGMVWLLTAQNSQKGAGRLLERYGGRKLGPARYACPAPEPQDLNRLHSHCRITVAGDTVPRRLFGTIIERRGRFKFVSYANEL